VVIISLYMLLRAGPVRCCRALLIYGGAVTWLDSL